MKSPVEAVISDFSSPTAMSNFRLNADRTLSKREGYYKLADFDGSVRGAYAIDNITYTVIGSSLYKLQNAEFTLIGEMSGCSFADDDEKVSMFCHADVLYIIGGGVFYCYNMLEDTFSVYQPYVPLILKNTDPYGNGEVNEPYNIISVRVKVHYSNVGSDVLFYLPEPAESVTALYLDDSLVSSSDYSFVQRSDKCYIEFPHPRFTADKSDLVVEFIPAEKAAIFRKKYLSNVNAFLYSDAYEARLFLYGKNTSGKIMLAVDRNGTYSTLNPSLDYIPEYSYFSLFDGNRDIYKILRFNDAVIAVTPDGTQQILKRTNSNGIEIVGAFHSKNLATDFSATEKSGIVIADDACYAFSKDGLLSLTYIERDKIYSVKRLEIPDYICPPRNLFSEITLHFNKIKDELWCCCGGNVSVYNIRHSLWYKFTDITADSLFIFDSQTAFSHNGSVYLFDEDVYTDNSVGFDAYYESGIYDLGNIFKSKTVFGFGAAIENIYGATLICTLKNDKDAECNIKIRADHIRSARKFIECVHARLGSSFYVTLRMESPADSPPIHVKSIMLRYR